MANLETTLLHQVAPPVVIFPAALPSTAVPKYINTASYGNGVCFLISVNNATTVTGSAVTVTQATAAAGTGAKAVAFTQVWRNLDTQASGLFALAAVTANTFTTLSTNSKSALYIVEVPISSLDTNNGFSYVRVSLGDAVATVIGVIAVPYPPRWSQDVQVTNPLA